MGELDMFKTTLMGGYDKDDVQEQVRKLKDDASAKISFLKKEMELRDKEIAELKKRLELREAQQARLEEEIHTKYQKYIDRYDTIGKLVFEAQMKADDMMAEAEKKCQEMIGDAEKKRREMIADGEAEARRRVDSVQAEIEAKLTEGKTKYLEVQEEMNGIVELISQAQKRFLFSYEEVHKIISTMPTSFKDMQAGQGTAISEKDTSGDHEVHLGDTSELEVLDVIDSIADLDEFDAEDEINDKLVNKIHSLLGENLEEDLGADSEDDFE